MYTQFDNKEVRRADYDRYPSRNSAFALFIIAGALSCVGAMIVLIDIPLLALRLIVFASCVFSVGYLLVLILVCYTKKKWPSFNFRNGAAVGLCVGLFFTMIVMRYQSERALRRGDELLGAIQAYHSLNGSYPGTLEHLVPQQLDSIPMTGVGLLRMQKFGYLTSPLMSLSFATPGDTGFMESVGDGEWRFTEFHHPTAFE